MCAYIYSIFVVLKKTNKKNYLLPHNIIISNNVFFIFKFNTHTHAYIYIIMTLGFDHPIYRKEIKKIKEKK